MRRISSWLRLRGALWMLALALAAAPARSFAQDADETHLHVQLKVVEGRFAVDTASLKPSSTFATDYRLSPDAVKDQLVARLARALIKTDKIATLDGGVSCASAKPDDENICNFEDGSWAAASKAFGDWQVGKYPEYDSPELYLANVLAGYFLGVRNNEDPKFQQFLGASALAWVRNETLETVGVLDFIVRAPISDRRIEACSGAGAECPIVLGDNAGAFDGHLTRVAMARSLRPLSGEVWDFDRIRRQLGDVLGLVGFGITPPAGLEGVTLSSEAESGNILVGGPRPISTIQFQFPQAGKAPCERQSQAADEQAAMMKVLYLLLPDQDFRTVRSHPEWIRCVNGKLASGDPARFRSLRIPDGPAKGQVAVPYGQQMSVRLAVLTPLGFKARLMSSTEGAGLAGQWTRVQIEPQEDEAEPVGGGKPTGGIQAQPRHRLLIGGGAQPHKPSETFVEYSQAKLLGDDTIKIRAGSRGKSFVTGDYEKDFVNFAGLGRRLTLSIQGASDYAPDVPDGTARADERRSSGSVGAGLQLFRDRDDQALQLNAAFGYEDVSLDGAAAATPSTQTAHLTLGATYAWIGGDTLNRPNISIEPSLTRAWGEGSTPSYWKGAVRAVVHDSFENFFEYDGRAAFDWASDSTPRTELPRLGGEESLRGLRADAAAGTFVWSVQNELWAPLRFTDRFGPKIDGLLRNSLKLAAFVDMGGASRNLQGLPGFTAGVGLGLRFKPSPAAALRLDWAHLVTRAPHGMSDQSIYFSIVLIPFKD